MRAAPAFINIIPNRAGGSKYFLRIFACKREREKPFKKILKKGLIFSAKFGILVKPIGDTERYSNW
jgi:hypothetical protein